MVRNLVPLVIHLASNEAFWALISSPLVGWQRARILLGLRSAGSHPSVTEVVSCRACLEKGIESLLRAGQEKGAVSGPPAYLEK